MCSWHFILFSYQGANMKKIQLNLVALVLSFFVCSSFAYAAGQADPSGLWQTPRSVLRISNVNGVLSAQVVKIRKQTASGLRQQGGNKGLFRRVLVIAQRQ